MQSYYTKPEWQIRVWELKKLELRRMVDHLAHGTPPVGQ